LEKLCVAKGFDPEYGAELDDDENLPYDGAILDLRELPKLKELDVGAGNSESRRYLQTYSLSEDALEFAICMPKLKLKISN